MAGYSGPRSCTWTEFPAHVSHNSSALAQRNATASSCDLTLLTCVLIGSYRFCIVPLLTLFTGKGRQLWRCKYNLEVNNSFRSSKALDSNIFFCFLFIQLHSVALPFFLKHRLTLDYGLFSAE